MEAVQGKVESRIAGSISPVMQQVLTTAEQAARSDAAVLIIGESGTGKSVLAEYIHRKTTRRNHLFLSIAGRDFAENEICPRPDDPDEHCLSELLNLHLTCEKAGEARLLSVHATALFSAVALLVNALGEFVPADWHDGVWAWWNVVVVWTMIVLVVGSYWRLRWNRCAARYGEPPVCDSQ